MEPSSRLRSLAPALRGCRRTLLILALAAIAGSARAASRTWSATPADGNWSNSANWLGGNPPGPGDDLTFPATSTILASTNDLSSGISIVAITFLGNGYTLSGNAITLGEVLCHQAGAAVDEIAMPVTVNATIVVGANPGCAVKFSGGISGPGGINSSGGGPVTIDGANTYTGPTEAGATGGFLILDGTLTGTSGVTVAESSGNPTLEGHGSFTANLTVNNSFPTDTATVSIGDGATTGILSTGGASFGATSTRTILAVKLNGTTAGSGYDQLHVGGNVNLAHAFLQVSLGFAPSVGDQFTIVKNDGGNAVTGIFEGLGEAKQFLVGDATLQITYSGGAGHDVVLSVVPTVATAAALEVDAAGNGVLEKNELATVAPTWTNQSGGSATLSGSMSLFTGPAQATTTFDIPDGNGSYGTIADGNSAACTDCYQVQLTAPANRPVQHWDTQINESIAPFDLIKTWTLHVGESFPDVPTSHPFYKFIENLFHNGVTGGCAGGNYCPSNPVTRGQMAVFLLKGEHGSNYLPPPCASTMFTDVPCPGGTFVDWINQLASESITGGCGNGQYCPGNSVTRGQMAVFLLKGEHGGAYAPPACSSTLFTDVPCPGGQFVNFINQLSTEGITGGCGNGQYCPGNSVTRGQMAVFLVKTFGLNLYGP